MNIVAVILALIVLTALSGILRAAFESGHTAMGCVAFGAAWVVVALLGFWLGRERGR